MACESSWESSTTVRRLASRQRHATPRDYAQAEALAAPLEHWYTAHGRQFPWRNWRDDYRLAVTEVLLQRTRAATVAPFVLGFFAAYPDWHALASAKPPDLEKSLAPIGLQARRAQSLSALARYMLSHPGPITAEAPGVGQYVERAVAVASDDAVMAMIDSNWVRILHRAFAGIWMADYRYDQRLQQIASAVVEASTSPRRVNWATLDLGSLVCKPRMPRCTSCPVRSLCEYGRVQTES